MSSAEFVRICQNLTQLTEAVRIDVKDTSAIFSYTGKTGKGRVNLKKNNADKEEDQIDISAEEDVSSQYGLKYLNSFAKASSLSQYVTLNCSSKFPLMIDYKIENLGFIKFFLAPKLDDDNDK
jgi:proliferating cell nuclear antigen